MTHDQELTRCTQVIIIAQQIAQGMGYLHHKGIIHKVSLSKLLPDQT